MMDFSDGATGSSDEEEPELKFQHEIRNPIVYTTKLDEMEIFRDVTTDMSVDTIINSIIKESKPKLNWKRKYAHTIHSHYSYEDLSYHIKTFNRKVARIAEDNSNLLSMCKPVKVVLEDIKYSLLCTQGTENKKSKKIEKICPIISDNQLPSYSKSRKLQSKILIYYDLQLKEADMYSLDKSYFIKEYTKFRIDKSNSDIFRSLRMNKNVSHVSCCCWYNREKSLALLPLIPRETLRFMRKPHKCAINHCRCCCRIKTNNTSSVRPSSLKPLESHSIWLNRMIDVHASLPPSDKSKKTLLSKAMSAEPKLEKNKNPVVEIQDTVPFLHSTNIDFGGEYYAIGADGQIKLHLKNTENERRKLSNLRLKTANNIVGHICCWYKREEFAGRLMALGALPNTVNYIRSAHLCSPTNCSCCCKPLNTGKPELTLLNKSARHTNDLDNKKVNIEVRFSGDAEKPANPRNENLVSCNISLSALEMISKGKPERYKKDVFNLLIPESATLDKNNSSVRVLLETTPKRKIVIECTRLNNFTTNELRMLDLIFCALNETVKQPKEEKKTRKGGWKNYSYSTYHMIYPLLLNKQLSITADLRSKRFLPSLRAHLDKYILPPQMKNISDWINSEANLESTITIPADSKINANENKIKNKLNTNKKTGK